MNIRNILYIGLAFCSTLLSSCNGGTSNGTKFNPQERESKFASNAEREAAIAQKRAELQVDVQTLLFSNDVKMSVIPPAVNTEDITENVVEQIALKMLEITSQNGIGGVNNVPGFALAASMNQTGREVTGTAPQMMAVQYTISYKVINTTSGDVYATASQDVHGAGRSFEEATQNAVNDIKNSNDIQQMLKVGSEKILSWFENNVQTFKNQVESAEGRQDYALALAYVESVPEKAVEAFEYATMKQKDLLPKFLKKVSTQAYNAMQAAVTAANGEYSPEVAANLALIPVDTPEYEKAQELYSKYEGQIAAKLAEEAARQQATEERLANEKAMAMKYAHELDMAKIGADLADADAQRANDLELTKCSIGLQKAKYEAEAVAKQHRSNQKLSAVIGLGSGLMSGGLVGALMSLANFAR